MRRDEDAWADAAEEQAEHLAGVLEDRHEAQRAAAAKAGLITDEDSRW